VCQGDSAHELTLTKAGFGECSRSIRVAVASAAFCLYLPKEKPSPSCPGVFHAGYLLRTPPAALCGLVKKRLRLAGSIQMFPHFSLDSRLFQSSPCRIAELSPSLPIYPERPDRFS